MTTTVSPYRIEVPQARLDRIRADLLAAQLPPSPAGDTDWRYGTDVKWLAAFLAYWANDYDWRAQEAELNALEQVKVTVDGVGVHAFHLKGSASRPRPLVLTHGWPGSPIEFLGCIERLRFPERFGGDAEDGLDLVIPSLPGVGFSDAPSGPLGPRHIAGMWRKLMTEGLGYERFATQGGDFGSAVSTWLGADHADVCVAVHQNLCVPPMEGEPQSEAEAAWRRDFQATQMRDSAYMMQHATRPQTVAIVLDASPVAAAGWMLEKFQSWADTGGDIDSRFTRDQLIANLMLYVAPQRAGTAIWLYRGAVEERAAGRFAGLKVTTPTAITLYPKEFLPPPPREVVERYYNVAAWNEAPAGGHFAAMEEPAWFAADVQNFLRGRL